MHILRRKHSKAGETVAFQIVINYSSQIPLSLALINEAAEIRSLKTLGDLQAVDYSAIRAKIPPWT